MLKTKQSLHVLYHHYINYQFIVPFFNVIIGYLRHSISFNMHIYLMIKIYMLLHLVPIPVIVKGD